MADLFAHLSLVMAILQLNSTKQLIFLVTKHTYGSSGEHCTYLIFISGNIML